MKARSGVRAGWEEQADETKVRRFNVELYVEKMSFSLEAYDE